MTYILLENKDVNLFDQKKIFLFYLIVKFENYLMNRKGFYLFQNLILKLFFQN